MTSTDETSGRRSQLEREGEVAADFLETLLDIADLDGDIDLDIDGDRAAVAVVDSDEGRVPRRLVGQDGRVLEALQELTRLAVQSATGERSRLMLDVAGHRAGRRSELAEAAQRAIQEVQESGEETSLEPMSAFERKVVHDEVLAAGLRSESSGSEPRRFVVVLPAVDESPSPGEAGMNGGTAGSESDVAEHGSREPDEGDAGAHAPQSASNGASDNGSDTESA